MAREVGHRAGEADRPDQSHESVEGPAATPVGDFLWQAGGQCPPEHSGRGADARQGAATALSHSKEDVYRTLADLLITAGRLPEAQQVLDLLKDEEYFEFVRRDAQTASTAAGRRYHDASRGRLGAALPGDCRPGDSHRTGATVPSSTKKSKASLTGAEDATLGGAGTQTLRLPSRSFIVSRAPAGSLQQRRHGRRPSPQTRNQNWGYKRPSKPWSQAQSYCTRW